VVVSNDAVRLQDLLLTDFGEGATAAEFDAVAVQALALMGSVPEEALDGLLGRLTEGGSKSRFSRWMNGAARWRQDGTGRDVGDAGEETVASAGDTVAPEARVLLMTALLARVTSCEAPEKKKAMLGQLSGAQLQGAKLEEAQLQGVCLFRAEFQGANLWRAQLQKAELEDARLQGATLYNAQLQEAKLNNAKLQGANLVEAQLQKTNLVMANLVGVEAEGADLTGAKLWGATVGAELEKDTKATNFREVCAPARCIRSLRSQHFCNTNV
jgi:hypothetical protein